MFEMLRNAIILLSRGKLFRNPLSVALHAAIGIAVTVLVCVGLVKAGATFWLAAAVAALVGGALQPWLFRNLKYN